ncbi:DUF1127 domain-containing protein [Pseudomonas sp. X10]
MNGLSDVRLQLQGEEQSQLYSAPVGLGLWGLMLHRWRTRRALLQLSDAQLRDVGLTWEQARGEGRKPFWRA